MFNLRLLDEATNIIKEALNHEDENTIFGAVIDESIQGEIIVTVIATGFDLGGIKRINHKKITSKPLIPESIDEFKTVPPIIGENGISTYTRKEPKLNNNMPDIFNRWLERDK